MPRKQVFSKIPVKKTGDANDKYKYEDKFASVTTTPLIQLHCEKISRSKTIFDFRTQQSLKSIAEAFDYLEQSKSFRANNSSKLCSKLLLIL